MSFSSTKSVTMGSDTYEVTFDATGAVKAYWFLNSGVTSFDKFTQFFYDIIIYGIVYPMLPTFLPQPSTPISINLLFDAITNLATDPKGTCCYNWNDYDSTLNLPYSQIGASPAQVATGCVITYNPPLPNSGSVADNAI